MKKPQKINEADDPIKITCGKCNGTAYIIPFPKPNGMCICANCTFSDKTLTLGQMIAKLFM